MISIPKHKKGESRKDWLKKCIPYVIKKEGLDRKAASGKCNGMYTEWKKKQKAALANIRKQYNELRKKQDSDDTTEKKYNAVELYEEGMKIEEGKIYAFIFDNISRSPESTSDVGDSLSFAEKASKEGYRATIVIGDSFMKGVFVADEELKKVYKQWNNTLHDINHMASGYRVMFSVVPSDVSYVVGYQDDMQKQGKEYIATIHIDKNAVRFDEWKSYIDICEQVKRMPNVSMFCYGQIEWKKGRDLPKDAHIKQNGYRADDDVPCMVKVMPYMVSTVLRGSCDDKKGCGIKHNS